MTGHSQTQSYAAASEFIKLSHAYDQSVEVFANDAKAVMAAIDAARTQMYIQNQADKDALKKVERTHLEKSMINGENPSGVLEAKKYQTALDKIQTQIARRVRELKDLSPKVVLLAGTEPDKAQAPDLIVALQANIKAVNELKRTLRELTLVLGKSNSADKQQGKSLEKILSDTSTLNEQLRKNLSSLKAEERRATLGDVKPDTNRHRRR